MERTQSKKRMDFFRDQIMRTIKDGQTSSYHKFKPTPRGIPKDSGKATKDIKMEVVGDGDDVYTSKIFGQGDGKRKIDKAEIFRRHQIEQKRKEDEEKKKEEKKMKDEGSINVDQSGS